MEESPKSSSGPIVILTGAGISAESGISTFRGSSGLWENHRIEDVASPEGFARNPELVQRFYNGRRNQLTLENIQPNAAHKALAKLEQEWPEPVLIVTQNIDPLHERGGSKNVLHMHGELLKSRCQACEKVFDCNEDLNSQTPCPGCQQMGSLRPHVVWFGETPLFLPEIFSALETCSLFMAIGTSSNVYPAAGFVEHIRMNTMAHTVELNLEPSSMRSNFHECIYGPASDIVPTYVDELLKA